MTIVFSIWVWKALPTKKYSGEQHFEKYNYQRLFLTADMDKYETPDQYCLPLNYKPETDVFFMYVEVTLLGCKYLCRNLHDLQCSLIVYMPFKRSCLLQPDARVHWVQCEENSIKVEIHRRRRTTGTPHKAPQKAVHFHVTTWKCCPHYWSFVRGIRRWPVVSLHKGPVMRSFGVFFDVRLDKLVENSSIAGDYRTDVKQPIALCNRDDKISCGLIIM